MLIEESLYSALSGYAPLAALVGTRISPSKAKDLTVFPCVTFFQVHGNVTYTQDGPAEDEEDIWQFDAWSLSYPEMRAVKRAIRAALEGAADFNTFIDQNQDLYEEKTRIDHGLLDARIWWKA